MLVHIFSFITGHGRVITSRRGFIHGFHRRLSRPNKTSVWLFKLSKGIQFNLEFRRIKLPQYLGGPTLVVKGGLKGQFIIALFPGIYPLFINIGKSLGNDSYTEFCFICCCFLCCVFYVSTKYQLSIAVLNMVWNNWLWNVFFVKKVEKSIYFFLFLKANKYCWGQQNNVFIELLNSEYYDEKRLCLLCHKHCINYYESYWLFYKPIKSFIIVSMLIYSKT